MDLPKPQEFRTSKAPQEALFTVGVSKYGGLKPA